MKNLLTTTKQLKNTNVYLVKAALKEMGEGTKAELSRKTGLSVATCNTILNELQEKGEVLFVDPTTSSGGRPARQYTYNMRYAYVLCIHIHLEPSRYRLFSTVTDLAGTEIHSRELVLEDMGYELLETTILRILYDYPQIKSVGIGLPCVVSQGGVVTEGSLPQLINLPLEDRLSQRLGVYVQVGNDVNYLAYGFYKNRGAPQESSVYLYFPQYDLPGCGIVLNGRIYQGNTQFAGEISYLTRQEEPVVEQVVRIAVSLTTILNPSAIAITGDRLTREQIDQIQDQCAEIIPEKHMPRLVYRRKIRQDYLRGLADLTVDSYEERMIYAY